LRALLPFIGAEVGRGGVLAHGGLAPSLMVAVLKHGAKQGNGEALTPVCRRGRGVGVGGELVARGAH
jgi:hypothetical protein